jgi:hypothetical protein
MARRTIIIDDLDASPDATTHRFSLDGIFYEIDLSGDNLAALRRDLSRYMTAGRRLARTGNAKPRTGPGTLNGRSVVAQVRDWWAAHWQELDLPEPKTHGAIPARVREAYDRAH